MQAKEKAKAEEKCRLTRLDLQLQLQGPNFVLVVVLCMELKVVLLQMNLQLQSFWLHMEAKEKAEEKGREVLPHARDSNWSRKGTTSISSGSPGPGVKGR